MTSVPRFSAIVVSFQVRELLRRCLESLRAQSGVELEIWVVDNVSSDGSAQMVAADFPDARLIRNEANVGFARANNLALARATGDYLALINPDTELPPDALLQVARVFERHPRAGVVGLKLVNPDGSPQPACHRFPGVLNQAVECLALQRVACDLGYGTPSMAPAPRGGEGVVDWVAGACMVLSRAAYHKVGGLDESRFLYGEEMDWSWRARVGGFETVTSNAATVVHHGGASGGARGELHLKVLEARLVFLARNRGRWRALLSREIFTIGAILRLPFWALRAALARLHVVAEGRTAVQLERQWAVVGWRLRGAAWQ